MSKAALTHQAKSQQQAEHRSPDQMRDHLRPTTQLFGQAVLHTQSPQQLAANNSAQSKQLKAYSQLAQGSSRTQQFQTLQMNMHNAVQGKWPTTNHIQGISLQAPHVDNGTTETVQRVLYKGPRTDNFYVRAPQVYGMKPEAVKKLIASSKKWYYDRTNRTVHARSKGKHKREKSAFVLKHESESKKAIGKSYKMENKKRKRITKLFARSEEILKKAKGQVGNKVNALNTKINELYNSVDQTSEDKVHFNFKLEDVSFSIHIPIQKNIKEVEDVLALTTVSLKETKGKGGYASMVEHKIYPTSSSGNLSFQYLYALEALRNPQFLPSLILKDEHVGSTIDMEDAINPELFGTFELKGAAGKERDKLEEQRMDSTNQLLDEIDSDDELKKDILDSDKSNFENECESRCMIQ